MLTGTPLLHYAFNRTLFNQSNKIVSFASDHFLRIISPITTFFHRFRLSPSPTPAWLRPPAGGCEISLFASSFFSHPSPFCSPSCSLAPFSRCSESLVSAASCRPQRAFLIIPQHVSHLHKHAAKNSPFPCQPSCTPRVKNISTRLRGRTSLAHIFLVY